MSRISIILTLVITILVSLFCSLGIAGVVHKEHIPNVEVDKDTTKIKNIIIIQY